jgi:RNA polymerase-binding transcription factor DksA
MDEKFLVGAEELQSAVVQHGIEKCRTKEATPSGFDGACGCGEEIPSGRVALGYFRCLTCQTNIERAARQRGR